MVGFGCFCTIDKIRSAIFLMHVNRSCQFMWNCLICYCWTQSIRGRSLSKVVGRRFKTIVTWPRRDEARSRPLGAGPKARNLRSTYTEKKGPSSFSLGFLCLSHSFSLSKLDEESISTNKFSNRCTLCLC